MKTSHQWVVVITAALTCRRFVCTFRTYQEACDYIRKTSQYQEGPGGDHLDIMKRLRSGVLTTEY